MPMFDKVLKKASLFWGCNVCENAQNSFKKFTWKKYKNIIILTMKKKTSVWFALQGDNH